MDYYLDEATAIKLITNGTTGVLCLRENEEGYPVSVPLSYVYYKEAIYILSEPEGEKMDQIRKHPEASFVIILKDHIVPQFFTVQYESVIIRGTAEIIEDPNLLSEIAQAFIQRFYSQFMHRSMTYMESVLTNHVLIRLNIQTLTGKVHDAT